MIRREAALRDRLTGKDGISRFDGSLSIGVTNIVFDSHATFVTDRKDGRGCFWRYGECWQVPRIFDGKLEWDSILPLLQHDAAGRYEIGSVDLGSLLGPHFFQLTAHNVGLMLDVLVSSIQDNASPGGGKKQQNSRYSENLRPSSDCSIALSFRIILILLGVNCGERVIWIFYFGFRGRDSVCGLVGAVALLLIGLFAFGSGIVGSWLIVSSAPGSRFLCPI
jgi:hypothetical protein